jgi:hypothetical protein
MLGLQLRDDYRKLLINPEGNVYNIILIEAKDLNDSSLVRINKLAINSTEETIVCLIVTGKIPDLVNKLDDVILKEIRQTIDPLNAFPNCYFLIDIIDKYHIDPKKSKLLSLTSNNTYGIIAYNCGINFQVI